MEGVIRGFSGSWMSGLGALIIETEDGIDYIHCQNAPTVRALDAAFGDVITSNHTVNQEAIVGKRIRYDVDFMGVLEGFTPVEVEG